MGERWHGLLTTHAFKFPEGKCCAEDSYFHAAIHDIMKAESCSIDSKIIVYYRLKSIIALSTEVPSDVNWTSYRLRFHDYFYS